jgi:hypothetical protein
METRGLLSVGLVAAWVAAGGCGGKGVGGVPLGGTQGAANGSWTVEGTYVSVCNWHGYAWALAGPETPGVNQTLSTATLRNGVGSAVCASGTVAAQADYGGYGLIGINIGQDPGEATPNVPVIPTGDGVQITVSNPGGTELRAQISDDLGNRWCAVLSGSGGMIPWSAFNTECWTTASGTDYALQPINAVGVVTPGHNTLDTNFDFCVESLTPVSPECGTTSTGIGGATGSGGVPGEVGAGGSPAAGGVTGSGGAVPTPGPSCITVLNMFADTAHTVPFSVETNCNELGVDCPSGSGDYTEYTGSLTEIGNCIENGFTVTCDGYFFYTPQDAPDCNAYSGCNYADCIAAGNMPTYCDRCLD